MYKTLSKTHLLKIWALVGIALSILLIFPKECRDGATNGVYLCIQVLIPSLFPFMVLAGFCVQSGILSKTPKVLRYVSQTLFCLPKETLPCILLSLIGGYPIGAKCVKELFDNGIITEAEAKRMSLFCVASGSGFLVTYLGTVMMGSTEIGYVFLVSQILGVIIIGILSQGVKFKKSENTHIKKTNSIKGNVNMTDALINGVHGGIVSCANMCAMVVLFGSVCEVFVTLLDNHNKIMWLTALIEITNGTKILTGLSASPVLISALCGFSGLCVHFQIFSILGTLKVPKILFYVYRILQGLITGGITFVILKLFPRYSQVFSTIEKAKGELSSGVIGCIFLIILCVVFLISVKQTHIKTLRKQ